MSKIKAAKRSMKKSAVNAVAVAKKVQFSLGDLIAAAFDTLGNDVESVAQIFQQSDLHARNGKRVVLG